MTERICTTCNTHPAVVTIHDDHRLCVICWDRESGEAHWREYNADRGWDEG